MPNYKQSPCQCVISSKTSNIPQQKQKRNSDRCSLMEQLRGPKLFRCGTVGQVFRWDRSGLDSEHSARVKVLPAQVSARECRIIAAQTRRFLTYKALRIHAVHG